MGKPGTQRQNVERTWKPKVGGILTIIAAVIAAITWAGLLRALGVSIILSLVPGFLLLWGGWQASKKRDWGLALLVSILSILSPFSAPFGIAATILVIMAKDEFGEEPTDKPPTQKADKKKQEHEIQATESQEEYKHSVWEIYRKEWETASPEKQAELNKRMLRWQELMKNGQTASQAYIKAMEEESDESPQLIPAVKKTRTKTRRYLLLVLAFVILLSISLIVYARISAPASEPSLEPTQLPETTGVAPIQTAAEVEEGWVRLIIEDAGSIDYPTDFLELQSGDYRTLATEYAQILELGKTDFTLQQAGLNELKPAALDEYRRVMLKTVYLNQGEEVFRASEQYIWSQEELNDLENQLIDELLRGFAVQKTIGQENKLVESVSIKVEKVNSVFPIVHTYKRQLNDNPVVLVKHYMFLNYDKIHHLTFSYRVIDEENCRDIYEKILYSFKLQ